MKINELITFVTDKREIMHVFFNETNSAAVVLDDSLKVVCRYNEFELSSMYTLDMFVCEVLNHVYEFIFIDGDIVFYLRDLIEESDDILHSETYKQRLLMQLYSYAIEI